MAVLRSNRSSQRERESPNYFCRSIHRFVRFRLERGILLETPITTACATCCDTTWTSTTRSARQGRQNSETRPRHFGSKTEMATVAKLNERSKPSPRTREPPRSRITLSEFSTRCASSTSASQRNSARRSVAARHERRSAMPLAVTCRRGRKL